MIWLETKLMETCVAEGKLNAPEGIDEIWLDCKLMKTVVVEEKLKTLEGGIEVIWLVLKSIQVIALKKDIWLGTWVRLLLDATIWTNGLVPLELMMTFRIVLSCESDRPKLAQLSLTPYDAPQVHGEMDEADGQTIALRDAPTIDVVTCIIKGNWYDSFGNNI